MPYRINPRRNMPGHILIKLTNVKHKEEILKPARKKQQITYKMTILEDEKTSRCRLALVNIC